MVPAHSRDALGSRIREHRKDAALTLSALARKLKDGGLQSGISVQHLSSVERGNSWPSPELVQALDQEFMTHNELIHLLRDAKVPSPSLSPDEAVAITAHLFFPLFVSALPQDVTPQPISAYDFVPRLGTMATLVDHAVLHCFPFHVVVLHEQHTLVEAALPPIAMWRRTQISRSATATVAHLAQVGAHVTPLDHEPYCLSVFVIRDLPWHDEQTRSRANHILAMPGVLASDDDSPESAEDRAAILLNSTDSLCDVADFSLTNSHFGAASWAGVSILPITDAANDTVTALVEFELQLQAFWCYASNTEARGAFMSDAYGARFLRQVLGKLQRPWPTEHTSVRRLREALVSTSRIVDLVGSAIEATDD